MSHREILICSRNGGVLGRGDCLGKQRLGGAEQYALLWACSSQDAVIAEKTKAPCSRQVRVKALC